MPGIPTAAGTLDDLRYALQSLARARVFTPVLLVSLALGTGANAAVFGVLRALLFGTPAGIGNADRLVSIYTSQFGGGVYGRSSYPDYLAIREKASAFASVAAIDDHGTENISVAGSVQTVRIGAASENLFDTLHMHAHRGRLLAPGDRSAAPRCAVISFALWDTLGAADDLVGKRAVIAHREYRIVGVAPPRFRGLQAGPGPEVWVPLDDRVLGSDRGERQLSVIARLRPGARIDGAQRELNAIADDLAARYPRTNRGTSIGREEPRRLTATPYSLDPSSRSQVAVVAAVLAGAVALLLASACVNAGSLLLSRGAARTRELAVKMALGATRRRLVRQLLTESLLISIGGVSFGFLLAIWTTSAIPALFSPEHAAMLDTRLDPLLVAATAGVAVLSGIGFGLAPALQATTSPASVTLRADGSGISEGSGRGRLRRTLVVVQIALSTVLLIGTGLLATVLGRALEGEMGITAHNVIVVSLQNPGRFNDPDRGVAFQRAAAAALQKIGGVEAAGSSSAPLLGASRTRRFQIETGSEGTTDAVDLDVKVVSATYFSTLGIARLEGRTFSDDDRPRSTPVVIIDELVARQYFGPVAAGRRLRDENGTELEVAGVVRTGRYRTLQEPPRPTVYFPVTQDYVSHSELFIRTSQDPAPLLGQIRDLLRGLDDKAEIFRITTLDSQLSEALAVDRLTTTLVGGCGFLALVMSTMGVYGLMSDAVRRRTREIGLRVALGAGRSQVARLVLAEAFYLTIVGILAGLGAVLTATEALQSLVFELPGPDPITLAATPGLMALVVAAAAVLPLRRALGVNPTIALSAE